MYNKCLAAVRAARKCDRCGPPFRAQHSDGDVGGVADARKRVEIRLHRIEACGESIGFHTDYMYSLRTSIQVPLNHENEAVHILYMYMLGGRLVFIGRDGCLLQPRRSAGSATLHVLFMTAP